jgi:hypothetical protein
MRQRGVFASPVTRALIVGPPVPCWWAAIEDLGQVMRIDGAIRGKPRAAVLAEPISKMVFRLLPRASQLIR